MTVLSRKKQELSPEQAGSYLLGVLLAGVRTGIYRILFNFYVLSQGYEEGLITILITASVMATTASVLPLSYIVDYFGKKESLIFSIAGTILSLVIMVIFPSRLLFLMMNMILGMCQALTQVSIGPAETRLMTLLDRVLYYSVPLAFATGVNYAVAYLPNWFTVGRGHMSYESELTVIGVIAIILFVFIDGQYNSHAQKRAPKSVYLRLNVGGLSIPLITDEDGEEYQEDHDYIDSIAEQVNFLLQGVLLKEEYDGPAITVVENEVGDLVISIEGVGDYIGVDALPEGKTKEYLKRASDLWVEGFLKE
jgi:MFS family permease